MLEMLKVGYGINNTVLAGVVTQLLFASSRRLSVLKMPERSRLLQNNSRKPLLVWIRRYQNSHKFIKSKAALLVLVWSLCMNLLYGLQFQPDTLITLFKIPSYYYAIFGGNAFLLCFYPLAGYLADNKFGRYKTILTSLEVLLFFLGISIIMVILINTIEENNTIVDAIALTINILASLVMIICNILFYANVIQFGIDQLHDSPADYQNLFLYWYVWTYYAGLILSEGIIQIETQNINVYIWLEITYLISIFLFLFTTLFISIYNQQWFLIDSARRSPYKLVYKVTKFSCQHKVPIHRSAFTYCEDVIPSGLNLGKNKYGGPFTTEEVEDVKAFYGILKILFALSFSFFLKLPCDAVLYRNFHVSHHINSSSEDYDSLNISNLLWHTNIFSSVIIILGIPVFVFILRPFCSHLSMLKAMGFGVLLRVLSVTCTLTMDIIAHSENHQLECMFYESQSNITMSIYPNSILYIQHTLYFLSYLFIYISLYRFICAQSPHSMKGLLIGLSYAVRGISEFFASVLIVPFVYIRQSFPSCGMEYYLVNIVVGVVGIVVYVVVSRKYKLRERDEPCHIYQFAEEYYSK